MKEIRGCPGCDQLLELVPLTNGQSCYCPRCGRKIAAGQQDNLAMGVFGLSLAGLLFYLPAIFSPLLSMEAMGLSDSGSVVEGVLAFYRSNFKAVAFIVLLTSVIIPLVKHTILLVCSGAVLWGRWSPRLGKLLVLYRHLWEWGMDEVYLIGLFVTLIKVHSMATIYYEPGFFAFLGLVVSTVLVSLSYDSEYFWSRGKVPAPVPSSPGPLPMSGTARSNGLMICQDCDQLFRPEKSGRDSNAVEQAQCPRCHSTVHFRTHDSVSKTWALLIAAAVLFIPANSLPIMEVIFMGSRQGSTILDGILYFFNHGSFGIGVIILTASVLVPLFKILGLGLILLSVRFRWRGWLKHKAVMYRCIVFIGRWSMLDIFVIALLCALVDFKVLSSVVAAPAASYFTAVVILTMLAAHTFDSRLLWDSGEGGPLDEANRRIEFEGRSD